MAGESIAEAYVRIRPDTSSFKGETTQAVSRDLKQTERELQRFGRGTLVGTGALTGLGRAAAFASTSFIGGAGLVYAIRSSIKEAQNQGQILANLRNSLQASGISWGQYRGEIERATEATKQASAFDDEELYKSLQLLIRGTGDVGKALKLNSLAADVARGRNLGLVQSAQLLVRVNAGQVGSLRRLGIQVDKGISGQKALIEVQRQYAGAAEAYTRTAIGAQTKLSVAIGDTEKAIGRALLPTVKKYEIELGNYLGKAENQRRLQEKVTSAVQKGTKVISGFKDAINALKVPLEGANRLTGGFEHTLELVGGLYVLKRVGLLNAAIRSLGTSFTAVGVDAAASSRVAVASMGTMTAAAVADANTIRVAFSTLPLGTTATGPATRGAGGGGPGVAPVPVVPGLSPFAGIAVILAGGFPDQGGAPGKGEISIIGKGLKVGQTITFKNGTRWRITRDLGKGTYAAKPVTGLGLGGPQVAPVLNPNGPPTGRFGGLSGTVGPPVGIGGLTALERNRLALGAAAGTPSNADDLRLLREQRGLLATAIATETSRLANAPNRSAAKKFADNLASLQDADNSALGQIQSIEVEAARKAKDARDAIARAAKEKERRQMEAFQILLTNAQEQVKQYAVLTKRREALAKQQEKIRKDAAKAGLAGVGGAAGALFKGITGNGGKPKDAAQSFTLAQLYAEAESEFKLYGSNYGPRETILSPQQERGSYSNLVLKQRGNVTVVQNFHAPTKASAAMNEARAAARTLD